MPLVLLGSQINQISISLFGYHCGIKVSTRSLENRELDLIQIIALVNIITLLEITCFAIIPLLENLLFW